MSDPSADPTAPRAGVILGVAFGLALIGGASAAIYGLRAKKVDAAARLDATFEVGAWPYGLVVVESKRMPFGEELVRLADPAAPVEAPVPKVASDAEKKSAEGDEQPKFDWSKVPTPADQPPREVTFVWYPPKIGEARMRELFGGAGGGSLRDLSPTGGTVEVGGGALDWGAYAPDFVHRRTFEADHSFRDVMRVNLTTPLAYCLMELRWTRGHAGTKEHANEILKALTVKTEPH